MGDRSRTISLLILQDSQHAAACDIAGPQAKKCCNRGIAPAWPARIESESRPEGRECCPVRSLMPSETTRAHFLSVLALHRQLLASSTVPHCRAILSRRGGGVQGLCQSCAPATRKRSHRLDPGVSARAHTKAEGYGRAAAQVFRKDTNAVMVCPCRFATQQPS